MTHRVLFGHYCDNRDLYAEVAISGRVLCQYCMDPLRDKASWSAAHSRLTTWHRLFVASAAGIRTRDLTISSITRCPLLHPLELVRYS